MHLGVVGHNRIISLIQTVLAEHHPEIETTPIPFNTTDLTELIDYLKKHELDFDGLLFTGPIPYDLLNSAMISRTPWTYVRKDPGQLLGVLLEASYCHHYDISQVSIDSYDAPTVQKVYEECHIPKVVLNLHISKESIYDGDFLKNLNNFHKNLYIKGQVSFCITGISSVYEYLIKEKIPCMMLDPTTDGILDTLDRFLLKREINQQNIAVLAIERDLPNAYALIRENEYQLALEGMKIAEEIYLFAQRLQAAVVEKDMSTYLLITTQQLLELETNGLKWLPLLKEGPHRFGTLSIGIGYGVTARESKYNANLGLLRAKKNGGHQAYKVENNTYMGPIMPATPNELGHQIDGPFQVIASKSGLSLNAIMKFQRLLDDKKVDSFTPDELANAFGISLRSMNRLLEKLLSAGYAQIIGRHMQGDAGRPSRIIRLKFIE